MEKFMDVFELDAKELSQKQEDFITNIKKNLVEARELCDTFDAQKKIDEIYKIFKI